LELEPFLYFLFDPARGFTAPVVEETRLSFTSDCTDWLLSARELEEPLISALENGLDLLGLRILTPLCPIISP
jgi:hypothetical protein